MVVNHKYEVDRVLFRCKALCVGPTFCLHMHGINLDLRRLFYWAHVIATKSYLLQVTKKFSLIKTACR
jgi:hypothetical protein